MRKKSAKKLAQELANSAARYKRQEIAARLRSNLKELREKRKELLATARTICGRSKARTRAAIAEFRAQERARIKSHVESLRGSAIASCAARRAKINAATSTASAKRKLLAQEERELKRELEQLRTKRPDNRWKVRRETDAEVRANIDPIYHPVWERVKSTIQPTDRASRTELFTEFLEANPEEVEAMLSGMSESHLTELDKLNAAIMRKLERARGSLPNWTRAEAALLTEQGIDPYDKAALFGEAA